MSKFIMNMTKTGTTSVIAFVLVMGYIVISAVSLFHKAVDKEIALLIISSYSSLVGFVAGYYFNKKTTTQDDSNSSSDQAQ